MHTGGKWGPLFTLPTFALAVGVATLPARVLLRLFVDPPTHLKREITYNIIYAHTSKAERERRETRANGAMASSTQVNW